MFQLVSKSLGLEKVSVDVQTRLWLVCCPGIQIWKSGRKWISGWTNKDENKSFAEQDRALTSLHYSFQVVYQFLLVCLCNWWSFWDLTLVLNLMSFLIALCIYLDSRLAHKNTSNKSAIISNLFHLFNYGFIWKSKWKSKSNQIYGQTEKLCHDTCDGCTWSAAVSVNQASSGSVTRWTFSCEQTFVPSIHGNLFLTPISAVLHPMYTQMVFPFSPPSLAVLPTNTQNKN